MSKRKARQQRYQGPPGDDRTYWLPRDRDTLDAAWDHYYSEHPEREPKAEAIAPGPSPENSWDDVPF